MLKFQGYSSGSLQPSICLFLVYFIPLLGGRENNHSAFHRPTSWFPANRDWSYSFCSCPWSTDLLFPSVNINCATKFFVQIRLWNYRWSLKEHEIISIFILLLANRLLHHRYLYQYVHKIHHEWQYPMALTALYCHPIEQLIMNTIPAAMVDQ